MNIGRENRDTACSCPIEKRTFSAQHNGYRKSKRNRAPCPIGKRNFQQPPSTHNTETWASRTYVGINATPEAPCPCCPSWPNAMGCQDLQQKNARGPPALQQKNARGPPALQQRGGIRCPRRRKKKRRIFNCCGLFSKRKPLMRLNNNERNQLQELYDTPCSSVTFNNQCQCVPKNFQNWECKSLNLEREYQCCDGSTRHSSRCTMVFERNATHHKIKPQSSTECCCCCSESCESSKSNYVTTRVKCDKSKVCPKKKTICMCHKKCPPERISIQPVCSEPARPKKYCCYPVLCKRPGYCAQKQLCHFKTLGKPKSCPCPVEGIVRLPKALRCARTQCCSPQEKQIVVCGQTEKKRRRKCCNCCCCCKKEISDKNAEPLKTCPIEGTIRVPKELRCTETSDSCCPQEREIVVCCQTEKKKTPKCCCCCCCCCCCKKEIPDKNKETFKTCQIEGTISFPIQEREVVVCEQTCCYCHCCCCCKNLFQDKNEETSKTHTDKKNCSNGKNIKDDTTTDDSSYGKPRNGNAELPSRKEAHLNKRNSDDQNNGNTSKINRPYIIPETVSPRQFAQKTYFPPLMDPADTIFAYKQPEFSDNEHEMLLTAVCDAMTSARSSRSNFKTGSSTPLSNSPRYSIFTNYDQIQTFDDYGRKEPVSSFQKGVFSSLDHYNNILASPTFLEQNSEQTLTEGSCRAKSDLSSRKTSSLSDFLASLNLPKGWFSSATKFPKTSLSSQKRSQQTKLHDSKISEESSVKQPKVSAPIVEENSFRGNGFSKNLRKNNLQTETPNRNPNFSGDPIPSKTLSRYASIFQENFLKQLQNCKYQTELSSSLSFNNFVPPSASSSKIRYKAVRSAEKNNIEESVSKKLKTFDSPF